jgi:hypothetical protein
VRRIALAALTVLATAAGLVVNAVPASAATPTTTAAALLRLLRVAPESHTSTYVREYFPYPIDADHDGCNTRKEVLIAESLVPPVVSSSCSVKSGRWYSYYDATTWTQPSSVEIDHVVALKEAWDSGAWSWSPAKRQRYANDLSYPYTLQAVSIHANRIKLDYDPAQWLPPRTAARCTYAVRWVAIKYRWGLSVDTAERNRLASLLTGSCGATRLAVPPRGA